MVKDNIARQVLALPQGWVNEAEQHRVETNARLLARGKAKPKKGESLGERLAFARLLLRSLSLCRSLVSGDASGGSARASESEPVLLVSASSSSLPDDH